MKSKTIIIKCLLTANKRIASAIFDVQYNTTLMNTIRNDIRIAAVELLTASKELGKIIKEEEKS